MASKTIVTGIAHPAYNKKSDPFGFYFRKCEYTVACKALLGLPLMVNHRKELGVIGLVGAAAIDAESGRLRVTAVIHNESEMAREVTAQIKTGKFKGFSIGFMPDKESEESGQITRMKLIEVSICENPAKATCYIESFAHEGEIYDFPPITNLSNLIDPEEMTEESRIEMGNNSEVDNSEVNELLAATLEAGLTAAELAAQIRAQNAANQQAKLEKQRAWDAKFEKLISETSDLGYTKEELAEIDYRAKGIVCSLENQLQEKDQAREMRANTYKAKFDEKSLECDALKKEVESLKAIKNTTTLRTVVPQQTATPVAKTPIQTQVPTPLDPNEKKRMSCFDPRVPKTEVKPAFQLEKLFVNSQILEAKTKEVGRDGRTPVKRVKSEPAPVAKQ
jgi:HK97 family phage prohead protease